MAWRPVRGASGSTREGLGWPTRSRALALTAFAAENRVVGQFAFPQDGEAEIWHGACLNHSKIWSLLLCIAVIFAGAASHGEVVAVHKATKGPSAFALNAITFTPKSKNIFIDDSPVVDQEIVVGLERSCFPRVLPDRPRAKSGLESKAIAADNEGLCGHSSWCRIVGWRGKVLGSIDEEVCRTDTDDSGWCSTLIETGDVENLRFSFQIRHKSLVPTSVVFCGDRAFSHSGVSKWKQSIFLLNRNDYPSAFGINDRLCVQHGGFGRNFGRLRLMNQVVKGWDTEYAQPPLRHCVPVWRLLLGGLCVWIGCFIVDKRDGWRWMLLAIVIGEAGTILFLTGITDCPQHSEYRQGFEHGETVSDGARGRV